MRLKGRGNPHKNRGNRVQTSCLVVTKLYADVQFFLVQDCVAKCQHKFLVNYINILRLRNDLYCFEWGVKLYSPQHRIIFYATYVKTVLT